MALDLISIGMRIRNERTRQDLSQEDLSEMTGISRQFISIIERGERIFSIDRFVIICNALNVSSDEILTDNLTNSHSIADTDLHYLLLDCSNEETKIIVNTALSLKNTLKEFLIK